MMKNEITKTKGTNMKTPIEPITLHLDEGLPVVRRGQGESLLRGSSLTEGDTWESDADFIRSLLETDEKILIHGKLY